MKDFDTSRASRRKSEEDRTFVLHGETFVMRSAIHPDALSAYDNLTEDTGVGDTMKIVDDLIVSMIEETDNAHERYFAVRADLEDPVTIEDLQELVTWMVEAQTARPTGQPGVSSPGQQRTGTPLRAISSSQAEKAGSTA